MLVLPSIIGHLPSLIRVFTVRMKKAWVLNYPLSAQCWLWSDWADAQADLSLRWLHMPFWWFCHVAAQLMHFNLYPYLIPEKVTYGIFRQLPIWSGRDYVAITDRETLRIVCGHVCHKVVESIYTSHDSAIFLKNEKESIRDQYRSGFRW